ncbi:MAG: lysophospholipid transporter LplT [Burkholderiales bacterium]|nr:lysophospholipid transporter LplT [Burkholderiales bacterium]
MKRGFYIILAAQFFSALADNALLFAAIALLKALHAPDWQVPVLQQFFIFSYIVLAAFVGAFADALPKGRVMFISNMIKFIGCVLMLAGLNPLFAYAIVGVGAAAYSPAKYGILTEYLPADKLVWANGWMEGLTVGAIILGAVIGGFLITPKIAIPLLQGLDMPLVETSIDTAPEFAVAFITGLYVVAAIFNLYIPKMAIDHKPLKGNPFYILHDFWHCFKLLWRDPLGQVSLAVTTLFWGAGATLRLIVLAWAASALAMPLEQATLLTAWVALGIAVGSVLAAKYVQLENSVRVLPMGIIMGVTVMSMIFVTNTWVAIPLLIAVGAMGGFFVVPMNALLQHRGHLLMGAGHSIAVQNFNENLSILAMLGAYALMIKWGWTITAIMIVFGCFVSFIMACLYRLHGKDRLPTP